MGGNVVIENIPAQRISTENRDSLVYHLRSLFWYINNNFQEYYQIQLWDNILDNNIYYSGSTTHLFDVRIPQESFDLYKPYIGDIDIKVDKNNRSNFKHYLDSIIKELNISGFEFIGYKESNDQIISLWYNNLFGHIQIDFEFVDFIEYTPTNWSIFSRNSEWCDIEQGIKAVFHKLLLRAITGKELESLYFLNESGTKIKHELTSKYAFSVTLGLRYKFKTVQINGEDFLQKLTTKKSKYTRNVNQILSILFEKEDNYWWPEEYIKLANSFVGLTELIIKNCDREEIVNIYKAFKHSIFSEKSQKISRDQDEDNKIKTIALDYLKNKLYIFDGE
ncbi:MAG: hypothetical protein WC679_01910 [Bacteroidales bacterium]|jgi:hypothetical protein